MVCLDLSAAFDTVHHETLLNRLSQRYGIKETAHTWLRSYLINRQQFITIKGERSELQKKSCDVPQGSVMGPNLYEDYTAPPVADIFRSFGIDYHIYADDKQAYLAFDPSNMDKALKTMQDCMEAVKTWMVANWLQLNDSKTECIIFGSKKNLSLLPSTSVKVGNADIEHSSAIKSIGAYLDAELTMDKQVSSVCRAGWYHLHQISRISKYLTPEQRKSVLHAHVTSRLDQNNSLLLGLPKKMLTKLQTLQNASARLVTGLKKREHITPTLRKLHWLPVHERIIFKILLLTFKCLNGMGPSYLSDMLKPYTPARTLRSSSNNLLQIPNTHYRDTERRSFSVRAPIEWNRLPLEIKNKKTVASFKVALKTYLFKSVYKCS